MEDGVEGGFQGWARGGREGKKGGIAPWTWMWPLKVMGRGEKSRRDDSEVSESNAKRSVDSTGTWKVNNIESCSGEMLQGES